MKKLIEKLRNIWQKAVRLFTSKAFVLAFPLCVFLFGAVFGQSFLLFFAGIIWLCPVILGVHEEED